MGAHPGARVLLLVTGLGFVLAGCAGSADPSVGPSHRATRGYYKVGAPYQVKGVWYYPKVDYSYDATGTASWYGEAFDRKPTANGEIFDLNQMTAAHKTLQLPSVVEVTNLQNGRVVQLRVNDRGPFIGDRMIDVSRRAAQLLGFEGAGTAPVRVRILKDESVRVAEAAMRGDVGRVMVARAPRTAPTRMAEAAPRPAPAPVMRVAAAPLAPSPATSPAPPPTQPFSSTPSPSEPAPLAVAAPRRYWPNLIAPAHADPVHKPAAARNSGRIFVQAGAFAVAENAQRVRARIAALGSAEVVAAMVKGNALYRVRLGPVASESEARRLLNKIVDNGYPTAQIVDH